MNEKQSCFVTCRVAEDAAFLEAMPSSVKASIKAVERTGFEFRPADVARTAATLQYGLVTSLPIMVKLMSGLKSASNTLKGTRMPWLMAASLAFDAVGSLDSITSLWHTSSKLERKFSKLVDALNFSHDEAYKSTGDVELLVTPQMILVLQVILSDIQSQVMQNEAIRWITSDPKKNRSVLYNRYTGIGSSKMLKYYQEFAQSCNEVVSDMAKVPDSYAMVYLACRYARTTGGAKGLLLKGMAMVGLTTNLKD